jgi:hypothetical protein
MSKTLPLKEMTLHEKLAAMEALWEDLARSPESLNHLPVGNGQSRDPQYGVVKIRIS